MLMAAFQAVGGPRAVYAVVPLLGAATVWGTYLLGLELAGAWAGAAASVLMLASPIFLMMLIQPMSDVPVAAFWTLACVWSLMPERARASGVAIALAIITRPNLAPLVLIPAALIGITVDRATRWRRPNAPTRRTQRR